MREVGTKREGQADKLGVKHDSRFKLIVTLGSPSGTGTAW